MGEWQFLVAKSRETVECGPRCCNEGGIFNRRVDWIKLLSSELLSAPSRTSTCTWEYVEGEDRGKNVPLY